MLSVVITVIVVIILSTIIIRGSSKSIYQAGENKIMQEITEVKKGVDTVRLANAKTGKTDEENINKGFIKVRVENPPENFVSFDEDKLTGYVVDLSVIDYEKLESGRGYLTLMKDDVVTFDKDDVYIYDNAGKVYYCKGYQIGDGDVSYTADNENRKDGPIVEVISTNNGVIKVKVTPIYGGEISSVIIGTKRATTSDGTNFELPVNKNGSYKIIATEEGGNSTVKVVDVGDLEESASGIATLKEVYINGKETFTNNRVATLHIDAENAAYMSISQAGLITPSPTDLGKWRKYESEISITLREGTNKIYVWCKNADDVPTDYKMAEIILDSTPPTREAPTYIIDGFKILVYCQQTDEISENLDIEYGFRGENGSTYVWQEAETILDVEPGQKYVLVTKATDEAGNTSESRSVLTDAIMTIPSDIKMKATPSEGWATRVTVEIEYPDTYGVQGFQNLYRIDGGEWKEVTSNRAQMTIIKNSKIEAVVSVKPNGQDVKLGEIKVLNIDNIDRVDPYIHDVEDIGPYRQDGFDIRAKVNDSESGLVAWTVTTSKDAPTTWDNTFESTTETIQMAYRVDVNDIYYFWAKDAGNNIGYVPIEVTNIDLYDPVISTFNIAYGTGEATLTFKAIDEELGINGYAFMIGQNATPSASDWIDIEQTITECTWTELVNENNYYSIWVRDVSGRISHIEKYVRVKYNLTYDYKTNDGDSISIANQKIIVPCNSNADLSPTAEKEYTSFVGWNTAANAKSALSSLRIGDPTSNQEDVTLFAIFKWEDVIYFSKSTESIIWELNLTISKLIPTSTLQYSFDNSSWTNYTSDILITKNGTVYARTLINGEVVKTGQISITNICENHTFSAATCNAESRCTKCNKYGGPKLEHVIGSYYVTTPATCTAKGMQRRNCVLNCGYYETMEYGPNGHTWGEYSTTTSANCVAKGVKTRVCSVCDATENADIPINSSNHKGPLTTTVTTQPGCTTAGSQNIICSACTKLVRTESISSTGHNYVGPTCTEIGVCQNCGGTQAALGHNWSASTPPRKCYRCGLEENLVPQAIYTSNGALTFANVALQSVGGTYNGSTINAVYTGFENGDRPWASDREKFTSVYVDSSFKSVQVKSVAYWFFRFYNCSYLDVTNLDVSLCTNMAEVFSETGMYVTSTFRIVGLENWNTANVTDFGAMFWYAGEGASTFDIGDLSGWNTSKATNTAAMFRCAGASAKTFNIGDISGWDMSNNTNIHCMFHSAGEAASSWYVGPIGNWNMSNVQNMRSVFYYIGTNASFSLDLRGWNCSSVVEADTKFDRGASSKVIDPYWSYYGVTLEQV